ncbi:LysR substrate-binding domain-containing protein [Mesorhizobium newzealandense]|uniref:LysR substrate-binding domain-containing protein n=1 Tax=Mesorhizobium newzealandense TaxID=1300302 RepID=A0ABW4UEL8_9HYPH
MPVGLDVDLLRSFVAIAEEKSFTRAAARVGRTQSAISLQMQRLEGVLGQKVIVRGKGGSVELNSEGHYLLGRARELLALNDDIMRSMHATPVHGTVRLGIPAELSARYLPRILNGFSQAAPLVEVEVEVAASCFLTLKLKNAELDLALLREGLEPRQWPAAEIWRGSVKWITSDTHRQHLRDPLPLSIAPADCPWRPSESYECLWHGMVIRALEQAGRGYRVVSTSATTQGMMAAAQAGLAVTNTLADDRLPEGLRIVRADEGLPALPECRYLMLKAREPRQPATDMLAAQVHDVFGGIANLDP